MIYQTEYGDYVISAYHVWIPGVYADTRAARYAFRFSDDELYTLQKRKNAENGGAGGVITTQDLQELRRQRKPEG